MGRSGGGHRAGGAHHSSFHHSSHYGTCNAGPTVLCCIVVIPLAFIVLCVATGVTLANELSTTVHYSLDPFEQVVVCPGELRDDHVSFSTWGGESLATLHYSLPPVSTSTNLSVNIYSILFIQYDQNHYWSFNLVKGSTVYWYIDGEGDYFNFYLIKGYKTYQDFNRGYNVPCELKKTSLSRTNSSYTVSSDDEYFVVVEAYFDSISLTNTVFSVEHTRYQTELNAEDSCDSSCTFTFDDTKVNESCIIVENTGDTPQLYADITYHAPLTTAFYACLGCAIAIGIILFASIFACIFCICKGRKGSNGQTFSKLESQPSYPAGNPPGNVVSDVAYGGLPPAYSGAEPSYGSAPPAY